LIRNITNPNTIEKNSESENESDRKDDHGADNRDSKVIKAIMRKTGKDLMATDNSTSLGRKEPKIFIFRFLSSKSRRKKLLSIVWYIFIILIST
jgi:hypothetical protein